MIPVLRDYQRRDLERLRDAFRHSATGVLYQAPTGSGKTVLFAEIVRGAVRKNPPVWIIVHRQELADQCSRALTALDLPHGYLAAGRAFALDAPALVASVQSLMRRLGRLPPPRLIVLDEAHHAVAGSWNKVLAACPGARILGVTATPERLDGKGLGVSSGGPFDALTTGPTVESLTAAGWLAPSKVYVPPQIADLAALKVRGGDFRKEELAARMDKPTVTGDAVAHYGRLCPGRPAIAFCTSIKHAEHTADAFRAAGWRAESIDGTLPDRARRQRIAMLGDGRLHVLTSCELISEGVDVPIVTAAILLRPTQSLGLHLQQVGRVLRPAPGKDAAIILDHVGNCLRHGFPDDPREWSLEGRPAKRKGAEGRQPMRICQTCFAAFRPAPACPYCGAVYHATEREIEEVEGDLREATEMDRQALRVQQRREVGRARDREALERIAAERGYKPGWVDYIMSARAKRGHRAPVNRYGTIASWKGEEIVG